MHEQTAQPTRYTGYEIRADGKLEYSYRSIRMAIGVDAIDGPPSRYTHQAEDAVVDKDPALAATFYLAAALVSAGMSRTLAYEERAAELARQARAIEDQDQADREADYWSRRTPAGGEA